MSIESEFRKAQGKTEAAVDKYGDKTNAAVQSNRKYIKYLAIAVAAIGVLLLFLRGV
jgi:ElaB/YqjD/DUF883 family membrane-anchored ribosome-binding protein